MNDKELAEANLKTQEAVAGAYAKVIEENGPSAERIAVLLGLLLALLRGGK